MRRIIDGDMNWRLAVLFLLALAAIVAAIVAPPVPQDPAYHRFVDQRTFFGVPHFWNVVSNVPFLFAGVYGLWAWRRARWRFARDRWPWLIVALAGVLICFGSGYYHWAPDNLTLFWDRLPMTLAFMAILSATVGERIHPRTGFLLLLPLLALGLLSVEVWRRGELAGAGDLRLYALVQFYPMLALPLIMLLFPARYTHAQGMWQMVGFYALAKVLEFFDRPVFQWTAGVISGHSIKHVAGAVALAAVFYMLAARKPSSPPALHYQ
jgi:hypothetical protein